MSVQNRRMTFRVTTLGCRVNHAETRDLEAVLLDRGLTPAAKGDAADIEVVHTCSVTHAAVRKSRQAVRRVRKGSRQRREPLVLVTGCATETDRSTFNRLASNQPENVIPQSAADGTTLVDRFARRLGDILSPDSAAVDCVSVRVRHGQCSVNSTNESVFSLKSVTPSRKFSNHIRAEVKIQDGCDAHCSFCIIPRIRRNLRSKSFRDVRDEVRSLVDRGHREVVLSGVFLGAYGHETALRRRQAVPEAEHLADLVDVVARVPGLQRLRLSSLEPGDVSGRLLDAMVEHRAVVVPHLHLPLQSGSDAVLRRMNRQYSTADYLEMIDRVNDSLTDPSGIPPAITTDILVGFPGESAEDFERTVAVVQRVGFLHMHVFPFSPRSGTAAARWKDQFVSEEQKKHRVRTLIDMEQDARTGTSILFRRRLLGSTVRIVLEQPAAENPGWMVGRCDHYAMIHVRTGRPRGTVMEAVVTDVDVRRTIADAATPRFSLPVLNSKLHSHF